MMKKISLLFLVALLAACNKKDGGRSQPATGSSAAPVAVEEGGEIDIIANPDAVPGGTLNLWGGPSAKTLNAYLDYNFFTKELFGLMFDGLAGLSPTENKPVGILAESWTTSPDGMTYTFKLNPKAKWSDGQPITAEDVQYYYDVIMNPKNLTSLFRVGLDRFTRPVVVDSLTFSITAKEKHWMNFWEASGLTPLPKHAMEGKDFNEMNWEFPVVSGPYALDEVKKERSISVKRRPDYWGFTKKFNQHKYNFEHIRWKFMDDPLKVLESLKKGDIDLYPINRANIWANNTDFDQVKKGWVAKQMIYNKYPVSFRGFVFNLRRPLFADIRLRQAMAYLANRKLMNEKLLFNLNTLLNTYFADLYPGNQNPDKPLIEYNPEKARALLAEAGYKPGPDGILAKDGKKLEITISLHNLVDLRPVNVYLEDLKKVGISAKIDQMSWSTWLKRMDTYEFDIGWAAWGASRLRDPESMWHSRTANQPSSNNVAGVQDKTVDSLIELQKTEMDMDKRNAILKKIDNRLVDIMPYILMWDQDSRWILYWNKFGTPKSVYDKFDDDDCITTYWSADPAKEKALSEAMKSGKGLTPPPLKVVYSE
jgi:microcin C transport system substrate-binding protein